MINRRGFLGAIFAAAAAPAIVKASSLMPIYVPKIITPSYMTLWGDGVHDDHPALASLMAGGVVVDQFGKVISQQNGTVYLPAGSYAVGNTMRFTKDTVPMVIKESTFKALPDFPMNAPVFHLDNGDNARIVHCNVIGNPNVNGIKFSSGANLLEPSAPEKPPFRKVAHGYMWGTA